MIKKQQNINFIFGLLDKKKVAGICLINNL